MPLPRKNRRERRKYPGLAFGNFHGCGAFGFELEQAETKDQCAWPACCNASCGYGTRLKQPTFKPWLPAQPHGMQEAEQQEANCCYACIFAHAG